MNDTIEYLTNAIRKARKTKRFSQRAVSQKTGLPQAQISKIENAAVDLKTSSLIALARALDLEIMMVPRQMVPAIKALISASRQIDNGILPARPVYALDDEDSDD